MGSHVLIFFLICTLQYLVITFFLSMKLWKTFKQEKHFCESVSKLHYIDFDTIKMSG